MILDEVGGSFRGLMRSLLVYLGSFFFFYIAVAALGVEEAFWTSISDIYTDSM